MKRKIRLAVSAVTSLALLVSIGTLLWWDEQSGEEPLLTGSQTPVVQSIKILDSIAQMTCPSAPALASLGDTENTRPETGPGDDDAAASELGPDNGPAPEAEESRGVFDPDYVPDTGDLVSQITAFSLGGDQNAPAQAELAEISSPRDPNPDSSLQLQGGTELRTGQVSSSAPGALIARTPDSGHEPQIAGLRYGSASYGDLRGIAAAPCQPVAAEQWLVGGESEAGASAELQLNNPSDTAAAVRIDLWGAAGPIDVVGTTSVLVPPETQRSVLLEGLAPGESRLAVRVKSTGARIGAVIQDVRTLGLHAAGVDYVTPSAAPAEKLTFPGVQIEDSDTSFLRLLAPGTEPGEVDVRLLGSAGEIAPADLRQIQIPGGSVSEISLSGIPAGIYTAVVEATVPVTGSAFVATDVEGAERDFAWMPGANPEEVSFFALPHDFQQGPGLGLERHLVVYSESEDALVTIKVLTGSGEQTTVEQVFIGAGTSRNFTIPGSINETDKTAESAGVVVEADAQVSSGLALRAPELSPAGITLIPATARSQLPGGVNVRYIP